MRTHGEHGVEQQYALVCPLGESSIVWNVAATVFVKFLINIDKRGWNLYLWPNRETQAVSLSRFMVGVLPENDGLYFRKRGKSECIEDIIGRWIDLMGVVFFVDRFIQLCVIRLGKLRL